MSDTIAAVYEQGVLRPLTPLSLPEHTQVQLEIISQTPVIQGERQQVRQALLNAGVIQPRLADKAAPPVSEAQLAAAGHALAAAGPLSELIIAEREGR